MFGWAGIEHHMVKHDSDMVKDYADDIDTLLVFVRKQNPHIFWHMY